MLKKKIIGRWMYRRLRRKASGYYSSRYSEWYACEYQTDLYLRSFEVPLPIKRFRIHLLKNTNGEWIIKDNLFRHHRDRIQTFRVHRIGLNNIEDGFYDAWIEYE